MLLYIVLAASLFVSASALRCYSCAEPYYCQNDARIEYCPGRTYCYTVKDNYGKIAQLGCAESCGAVNFYPNSCVTCSSDLCNSPAGRIGSGAGNTGAGSGGIGSGAHGGSGGIGTGAHSGSGGIGTGAHSGSGGIGTGAHGGNGGIGTGAQSRHEPPGIGHGAHSNGRPRREIQEVASLGLAGLALAAPFLF